ncbi:MAG: sulfatase [Kiritimatiellales bacterium]
MKMQGFGIVALSGTVARASGSLDRTRPNIVFIISHDAGRYLGCYGNKVYTPNLDGLASQGVRLSNAFCSSPACAPSRCCAYTGLPAHQHGVMGVTPSGFSLNNGMQTVVDYLNAAGYETAHVGFQHERHLARENRYQIEMGGAGDTVLVEYAVDHAISYIKNRDPSKGPFYLNIGTMECHASVWQDQQAGNRKKMYGQLPADEVDYPKWWTDTPELRREMGNFEACIQYYDFHIGRLLRELNESVYASNTLVVVTTDHGISGERSKGTLYDKGVETYFLARWPEKIPVGVVRDELIVNVDIAPTLLDAAGIDTPPYMYGRSFLPLLTGGPYTPHETVFTERNFHGSDERDIMRACRTKRWHYILNLTPDVKQEWIKGTEPGMNRTYTYWLNELWPERTLPRSREELFDMENDPLEMNNLADDPAYAKVLRDMRSRVRDYMAGTCDPAAYNGIVSVHELEEQAGRQVRYRQEAMPKYLDNRDSGYEAK